MPDQVPQESQPKSRWLLLLDFIEHPLLLWAAGVLAALVAYFIYPVLAVCGVCVMLAFHRAKVVEGLRLRWQIISYSVLFVVTTTGLLGVSILIKRQIPQLATLTDIRDLLRQATSRPRSQAKGDDSSPATAPPKRPASVPPATKPKIQVAFKASRLFENKPIRKTRIAAEISGVYEYLQTIGFNPPTTVPPIGTIGLAARRNNECGGVTGYKCPGSMYEQSILVIDPDVDRPQCIRRLYAIYVFSTLYEANCSEKIWMNHVALIFADYFTSSFDGKPISVDDPWNNALWEMRTKYGKQVVDSALLFMFNEGEKGDTGASWERTSGDRTFNDFFGGRFRYALYLSDSDFIKDTPGILKILEQRKLIVPSN